jgi:glycosyltransferase involved in cell wall biosynthesis
LKILLYTDLSIRPDQLFWHRDLGLLTKAFRALGHNALLVVHPATEPSPAPDSFSHSEIRNSKSPIPPVLWVSQKDVRDPIWWQSQKPDLVILGLWTRPKYDPIRRAALSAAPHVIERADSDGMRTASCGLLTYAKRRFDYFRDRTYYWPSLLSIPASIFYSFASIVATPWIEARLARTLKLLPAIAVETPPATALWKSLASRLGVNPARIHHVPHPIQTDIFKFDPAIQKKNQTISVGRWESYQKNLPLLLKTLRAFLDKDLTWTSLVIGSGLPAKCLHPRITLLPPTSPQQLAPLMQESKIFLSSSRYESFGLAANEAKACGCTTVDTSENHNLRPHAPLPNGFLTSPFKLLTEKIESASRLELIETSRMSEIASPSPQDVAKLLLSTLPNDQ